MILKEIFFLIFQITQMTSFEFLAYFRQIKKNNLHNSVTIWIFDQGFGIEPVHDISNNVVCATSNQSVA